MWIPLEVQGCLPIGILKLTLHYQRNPPLTFVYTHLPPRNVSVLHAVRDHRAQGRHWANLTGLYGHFSRAFGISKLDDFKAAGSKAEWREVCRAVEHNNTLYVPAADCDYQVKSAHKLLTLLREYKKATRIVVLQQHDPAEFCAAVAGCGLQPKHRRSRPGVGGQGLFNGQKHGRQHMPAVQLHPPCGLCAVLSG